MTWFFIALIGPILWAAVNHIDKYLLSDKFEGSNVGALMIFSTLLSFFLIPIFYLINSSVLNLPVSNILVLIIVGVLTGAAIIPYMYALDQDEATIVVPLFQLIPIWGYFLAFILLGETLTWVQMLGGLLIILGSIVITLEEDTDNKIKFKKRTIWLMILSTILIAVYETMFKFVAVDAGFVISTFWEQVGLLLFGIVLFTFFKNYRTGFIHLLKTQGQKVLSLNIGSEFITIVGNLATNFALIIAPVALVLTVNGFQPLFVLIYGVILTLLFPKFCQEKLSKKHLVQKIVSIIIIIVGSVLLR